MLDFIMFYGMVVLILDIECHVFLQFYIPWNELFNHAIPTDMRRATKIQTILAT